VLQFNKISLGVSFFLLLTPGSVVHAHPLDLGYFHAEISSARTEVNAQLELNPKTIEVIAKFPAHFLNRDSANLKSQEIFDSVLDQVWVQTGNRRCPWGNRQVKWIDETQIRISADANCDDPSSDLEFQFHFLNLTPHTFQVLGKVSLNGNSDEERSFLAEKSAQSFKIVNFGNLSPHFLQFVGMGIRHIGATPSEWKNDRGIHLPDGIDHILFIVALILGGGSFLSLLKTATGFTFGHSITLALASLDLVRLPSRWVESAIAVSIVYVAIEALFLKDSKSRWKIAMAFGLVHGFGFATALKELDLAHGRMLQALVGFNLGVELGQIVILAATVPLVLWLKEYSKRSEWLLKFSAASIAIIGSYWFVVRAFALS
jgi:hypothetical protein